VSVVDLHTRVGEVELRSPVMAASGTFGYGLEYDGLVDWGKVGAVSVKGLSILPWPGHPAPRMVETPAGMLNAIGLQNVGVEAFLREKLPALRALGTRVVGNCWGNTAEEYRAVVERLDASEGIDAIELNLACPNTREWNPPPSACPGETTELVTLARRATTKPLWVKLTPNVTDITEIARAAEGAGADALSLINTLRGMAIDVHSRTPVLTNVTGGLSGPAIRPVALCLVYETCRAVRIPVVGGGGIMSGHDAMEFLLAGARAVHVGTASLYDPAAPARIADEIADLLRSLGEASIEAVIGTLRTV
jgi:dihydroorotate dehydrogenase (NAD+) catalytic subunit